MDTSNLRAWLEGGTDPPLRAAHELARAVAALGTAGGVDSKKPRAYLVGGWVRDALLGRYTLDVDVEVHGVPSDRLERLIEDLFPDRINRVGRSFGIFKVAVSGSDLDVSIPRSDSKVGPGHKGFDVVGDPFMGLREASRRRDFTVNALAADPLTAEVFDPWNGLGDLRARRLRIVDPERFVDDPLRVWRGIQLAARLDLSLSRETFDLMRSIVRSGALGELSRERPTEEIRKLLLDSARPAAGFEIARSLGVLAAEFPEIEALAETPQDPEWHPEGDVFVHTMMVVDQAAVVARRPEWGFDDTDRLHVLLGALCHDLGKPATTTRAMKDGVERIVSPRHEAEGEDPARRVLARLTFGEDAERAALAIVRHHLQPYALFRARERGEIDDRSYLNAVRKMIKRLHPVPWRILLAAAECDWRGRTIPGVATGPFPAGDAFVAAVTEHALDAEPTRPLVLGRDVLALGIEPGPEVGRLIAAVESARDRGELETRDQGLELLRTLVRGSEATS